MGESFFRFGKILPPEQSITEYYKIMIIQLQTISEKANLRASQV